MHVTRIFFLVLVTILVAACGSPNTATPTTLPAAQTRASGTREPRATSAPGTRAIATSTPGTQGAGEPLKIAFLLSSIDSPRQELFEQILTEMTRNVTGTVRIETADNDVATQKIQVEQALADGAPVLVIQPVDPEAAGMYVDAAHKASAKVIAFDRLINTRDLDAYVSHDLEAIGRTQAQAAVDWLTAAKTKTPWNFVFLEGAAGDPLAAQITRGYHQVLDPLVGKKTVVVKGDHAIADWSAVGADAALADDLAKNKNNIQAVLANNSTLARGALGVLDAGKLTGKIFVAGSGADTENLRAICSGAQNLELTLDDAALARAAAELAMAVADDKPMAEAGLEHRALQVDDREVFHVTIPVRPITLDSIQAVLVQTGIVEQRQLGSCFAPLVTGASSPQTSARGALNVWVQEDPTTPVYAYLSNLAGAFMAANPGTEINLIPKDGVTVRETFADASDGVDLLWTTNEEIQQFAASELLRAVDFVSPTVYAEPAVAGGTREGTLYGAPVATGNNLVLYYNKKLLKEPPQNSDALVRLGATLTKEASGQYALVYDTTDPFWLMPWLAAYKGGVVDANGRTPTLDTAAMTETLTLLKTLKDKKVSSPDADLPIADAIFTEGRAAMIINGDEALNAYLAKFGADLGVTRLPQVSKFESPRPYTGGIYFAIPAGVEGNKLELAKSFIQLVSSKPVQLDMAKKFRRLPALNDALKDQTLTSDAILKGLSDQMLLGIPAPDSPILTCIWESIRPNQIASLNGTSAPDVAAAAMQAAASECIGKLSP